MLIGNKYSDNKMYGGIRHYNSLPLTSEDLHEYTDTIRMKNSYLFNNLIGTGVISNPPISISTTGVSLLSPSVILLDGDISLIQADGEILTAEEIAGTGITEGYLCVVGWYQHLTASSTLRSYGGVRNSILENDLNDLRFNVQVSTRYQFRWDTVIIDKSSYDSGADITIPLTVRDASGEIVEENKIDVVAVRQGSSLKIIPTPAHMDYALSNLYVLPILQYSYNGETIDTVAPVKSIGAISNVGFNTLHSSFLVETAQDVASPIVVPINIAFSDGDDLEVNYNGIVLYEGMNYSVNYDDNSITLLDFVTRVGDLITFEVTKAVPM